MSTISPARLWTIPRWFGDLVLIRRRTGLGIPTDAHRSRVPARLSGPWGFATWPGGRAGFRDRSRIDPRTLLLCVGPASGGRTAAPRSRQIQPASHRHSAGFTGRRKDRSNPRQPECECRHGCGRPTIPQNLPAGFQVAHALMRAAFTLSRKLAKARVYSECKSKQAVARKYTRSEEHTSELQS